MNRKTLMTGLIGLAMLALPIAASAQNNENGRNDSHQAQSQNNHDESVSHPNHAQTHANAPAHKAKATHNVAPATEARHDAGDQHTNDQRADRDRNATPAAHRDFDGHTYRNDRNWSYNGDQYDRDYYNHYPRSGAPYYEMPGGYAGGACSWARHLRLVYEQDRASGHPAAANDLLPQMQRAERACGVPYGYNR
jgi:hypothetical protein